MSVETIGVSEINYPGNGDVENLKVAVGDHHGSSTKFLSVEREDNYESHHYVVFHKYEDFAEFLHNAIKGGRKAFGQEVDHAVASELGEILGESLVKDLDELFGLTNA